MKILFTFLKYWCFALEKKTLFDILRFEHEVTDFDSIAFEISRLRSTVSKMQSSRLAQFADNKLLGFILHILQFQTNKVDLPTKRQVRL